MDKVTEGCITSILTGALATGSFTAIVLSVEPGTVQNYSHKLIIGDGVKKMRALLYHSLAYLVDTTQMKVGTVINVTKFKALDAGKERVKQRLLLIMDCNIVGTVESNATALEKEEQPTTNMITDRSSVHVNSSTDVARAVAGSSSATSTSNRTFNGSVNRPTPAKPSGANITPISSVNPYQNNFKIRAKVTDKSPLRTYTNQKGEGKVFNVTFVDESGEIKTSGFGATAETVYPQLVEGQVYFLGQLDVKAARKGPYNTVKHDYEMYFSPRTTIEPCSEDVDIPACSYNFVTLDKIMKYSKDDTADVIGIVVQVEDPKTFTSSKDKEMTKRDIVIGDQTGTSIRMTLWSKDALEFEPKTDPTIIAVKGARVSEYGGRTLSVGMGSKMVINPDVPESQGLIQWHSESGNNATFHSLSTNSTGSKPAPFKFLRQLVDENIGQTEATYVSVSGYITYIRPEPYFYDACANPSGKCNRKVNLVGSNYHCEGCQQTFEKCNPRYMLSLVVSDHSGQTWLSGFDDFGRTLFEKDCATFKDQMMDFAEAAEEKRYKRFNMKIKVAYETNTQTQELRMKANIIQADHTSPLAECERLLALINAY